MTTLNHKQLEERIFVNVLRAARNPENIMADGEINWCFVDSDAYIDTLAMYSSSEQEFVRDNFYALFDGVCFAVDRALEKSA